MKNRFFKIIILILAIIMLALTAVSIAIPDIFESFYHIIYGAMILIFILIGIQAVKDRQTWGIIILGMTVVMLGLYVGKLLK